MSKTQAEIQADREYAEWFAANRKRIGILLEEDARLFVACHRAQAAADALLYEGKLAPDDPAYLAAKARADALWDRRRAFVIA